MRTATGRLAVLLLSLLALSCEESPGPMPERVPPLTYLSVQGAALDTTDYRQILHWWGTDPDGRVEGYYIRWDGGWIPPEGSERWSADTTFVFTTATSDTFAVPLGGAFGTRTFCVRAVDEEGLVDPVGRCQLFQLRNQIPTLSWSRALVRPDTSLPVTAFAWHPVDHDGLLTVRRYLYWLTPLTDIQETAVDTFEVRDTILVVEKANFENTGSPLTGGWRISVQAVDEAEARSNVITHEWQIEAPAGDFLLIDNVGSFAPGSQTEDRYYRDVLESVAPGDTHVLDFERRGGFQTSQEVAPLFSMFRGVVWYGGTQNERNDTILYENLRRAEPGLRSYIEQGGRFALIAAVGLGDSAALTPAFSRDVLGLRGFFRADGSHNIPLERGSTVHTSVLAATDSLSATSKTLEADFLRLEEDVIGLFWVPPGFLARAGSGDIEPDQSSEPAYLGLSSERLGGRVSVVTFLLSRANGFGNGSAVGAAFLRGALLP